MRKLAPILFGLLAGIPSLAQNTNGLYSGTAQTLTYIQGQYVLAPLPQATITVCNYPATQSNPTLPCTNLALLYSGPTTATPAASAFAADAQGNFSFWALPGYYAYTVTNILTNVTTGPYSVVISSGSSGGSGGATFPFPGLVFATNSIAGIVATSSQIATALNTSPSTLLAPAVLPIATNSTLGVVRPDGTSVTINSAGVISSTPPTVSIPSTTIVLKGGGVPNVAAVAIPGADFVIPSGSITGSSASLSAPSTLPNATVATTQAPGDNTAKIATDAFVLANTGAATPATAFVLKGNGVANGVVAAAPGTDYVIPSGSITGTAANLSGTPTLPNGTAAATQSPGDNTTKLATDAFVLANSTPGGVLLAPSGNQAVVQPAGTSLTVNSENNTYFADGYPSSCTVSAVSYTTRADCAFYSLRAQLISSGNHGAKLHFGNGVYQTCAGLVNSNANPAPTISLEGEGVGGTGNGFGVVGYTSIQASCAIPKTAQNPTGAVIAHAPIIGSSISVPYGFTLSNLVIDPNGNSDQAAYLTAEKIGHIDHLGILSANQTSTLPPIQIGDSSSSQAIILANVSAGAVTSLYVLSGGQYSTSGTFSITSFTVPTGCPGSGATGTFTTNGSTVASAAVTAGGSGYVAGACAPIVAIPVGQTVSGSGYQFHATDIFVEQGNGTGPSSWATVTQTQSGGTPTFTVTSPGSYTNANPIAYWVGYGATNAPCTTMGTLVPTMAGTGPYTVTALTGYGFSGCAAGTAYNIIIADFPRAQYGWEVVGDTDATFKDIVVGSVGTSACVGALSGSDVYDHVHPIDCNVGVYDIAQNKYIAPEYDSSFQFAHQLGVSAQDEIYGAEFQYAQAQPYTAGFFIPSSFTGYWALYGNDCNHGASVTGFALAVNGTTGPVAHASGGAIYPGAVRDGMQCDTRAVVNYANQNISGQTVVLADSSSTAGVVIGTGAAATNFLALSAGRGELLYDNTNSNVGLQAGAGKGIGFYVNNTLATGLVGKFDSSGNFGVGTSQTVSSDPFNVTSVGAVTAGSVSSLVGSFTALGAGAATIAGAMTVAGVTSSAGITSTSDGVHAGQLALVGNTTNPSIPANQFGFLGFPSTSASALFIQPSTTPPTAGQIASFSAPASNVSTLNFVSGWHMVQAPTILTAQAANISATTLYTPAAPGFYRICMNAELTRAGTTSTFINPTFDYTSATDAVAKFPTIQGGSNASTSNATFLATGGCQMFNSAAAAIHYSTSGYASTGGTSMQYDLVITLEVEQ